MLIKHRYVSPFPCLLPILVLVLALAGCAKVQPEPFAKFSASIGEGQKAIEKTMTEMQIMENDHLVRFIHAEKDPDKLKSYKLTMSKDKFSLKNDKYFDTYLMMITNLNERMSEMNTALKKYSDLLYSLAAAKTIDDTQFATIKNDLKSAFDNAVKALNTDAGINYTKTTEGLATLFASMFRDLANRYQKKLLIDAIDNNQKYFESYVDVCKIYADLYLDAYYDHCYIPTYSLLVEKYSKLDTTQQVKDQKMDLESQQKEIITKLVALNSTLYNARLFSLNLKSFYALLPSAHKELGENLKSNKLGFDSLSKVFAYAQILHAINESLASKTTTAPVN